MCVCEHTNSTTQIIDIGYRKPLARVDLGKIKEDRRPMMGLWAQGKPVHREH